MGKSPVVVNDCPGFFVNRVLFPYFFGFNKLVADGADFAAVDKVMEKEFGWPMGPAYLLDVVGIDTGHHAGDVMAQGFPARMSKEGRTAIDVMYEVNRFGQKNGKGFYAYEQDKKGKPKKVADAASYELLAPIAKPKQDFDKGSHHRSHDDPDDQRGGALSGRGHSRHASRSRHRTGLRSGLPSLPRRRVPLSGHHCSGSLRGHGRPVCRLGPALPRQRPLTRDGRPGQNLLLIAERESIHERRSHCRLYPDPDGPVQGGAFRNVRAEDLSAHLMKSILLRNPNLDPNEIEDIYWAGAACSRPWSKGFNIARNAALLAGIPKQVGAVTVNRLCGLKHAGAA